MELLTDLNPLIPLLTLTSTVSIAMVAGLKVVYRYAQKRSLTILNQRIDNRFIESIKSFNTKLENHDDRIIKIETKIEHILDYFPRRQGRRKR